MFLKAEQTGLGAGVEAQADTHHIGFEATTPAGIALLETLIKEELVQDEEMEFEEEDLGTEGADADDEDESDPVA
jgi:hypothetical protein